jgi:hypothetical protein
MESHASGTGSGMVSGIGAPSAASSALTVATKLGACHLRPSTTAESSIARRIAALVVRLVTILTQRSIKRFACNACATRHFRHTTRARNDTKRICDIVGIAGLHRIREQCCLCLRRS